MMVEAWQAHELSVEQVKSFTNAVARCESSSVADRYGAGQTPIGMRVPSGVSPEK